MVESTRVVVTEQRFVDILLEAGIDQRRAYVGAPAFMGHVRLFAQFMIAAVAALGQYDAAMLAAIVREAPTENGSIYYFPGLELL